MAEQALYRKYRSADFDQVIGQDHIVVTLKTAVASGRTSHAYLFTGPRGVGKTSVARLLARALNCTGQSKPCNECANCQAAINSSLDVVEMDAASNRSIDAIRELRDKVALAPTIGAYKVYIIDEVHMLTGEAFNALLKTLEEPPSHAVFILATTEAHKVPETIVSRTQRFVFRPISHGDIVAHLQTIATAEAVDVELAALELLAESARGGFRDAISTLDQMIAAGQTPITAGGVRALLGYSDSELIASVSRAIAVSNTKAALIALDELTKSGASPGQTVLELIALWRVVMLMAAGATTSSDPLVTELAATMGVDRAATVVGRLIEVTRSAQPREALEIAVVALCASSASATIAPRAPKAAQPSPKPSPAVQRSSHAAEPAPESNPTSGLDSARWPKVVMLMKQTHNSLAALLAMYPIETAGDTITIRSRFNFHRDLFMKTQNRQAIEAVTQKVYGRPVVVTAITDEATMKAPARTQTDNSTELITSALEILGGEVVD